MRDTSPEPEPEPSAPETTPASVTSTMVRWPGGTAPGNGSPPPAHPETFEEATSIIPAWQHPDAASDSKRTVSLQAVPVEQISSGTRFAPLLAFASGPFAVRTL